MKSNRNSGDPSSNRKGGTPFWEKMKPKAPSRPAARPASPEKRSSQRHAPEKGWDQVAQWYDQLVGDEGSDYHKNVIVPAVM
jgi:hypothetical protein